MDLEAAADRLSYLADLDILPMPEGMYEAQDLVVEAGEAMLSAGRMELYKESRQPISSAHDARAFLGKCLTPEPQATSPYFDSKQAAAYIGITVKSLYGLVERGQLKPLRGPRRTYRFRPEMLDKYLGK